ESITALNNGLIKFKGSILFASHDHQFINSIANRLIEITPNGIIDKEISYDEYVKDQGLQEKIAGMYSAKTWTKNIDCNQYVRDQALREKGAYVRSASTWTRNIDCNEYMRDQVMQEKGANMNSA